MPREGAVSCPWNCAPMTFDGGLGCQFNNPKYADVIVKGPSEKAFYCHRVILASRSEYFDRLLSAPMTEGINLEVRIEEVENDLVLESLLRSLYDGFEFTDACARQAGPLFRVADHLSMSALADRCVEFMLQNCDCTTAIEFFSYTHGVLSGASVADKCKAIMLGRFGELVAKEEFTRLAATQIKWLLSSEELRVQSELIVFDALMRWIGADVDGRAGHLVELLPLVRFPSMTLSELGGIVGNEVAALEKQLFSDLLLQAFSWLTTRSLSPARAQDVQFKQRLCFDRPPLRLCTKNPTDEAAGTEASENDVISC